MKLTFTMPPVWTDSLHKLAVVHNDYYDKYPVGTEFV